MLTLRQVFRAYLRREIDREGQAVVSRKSKIAEGDLSNAYSGEKLVSVGMLDRISLNYPVPLSELLNDLAGVAAQLEAVIATQEGAVRPELRAVLEPSSRRRGAREREEPGGAGSPEADQE